jgi:prepilin-type N-terminal cleavage/methylation domain-containing protein
MKSQQFRKNQLGLTLIEMLVAIVIGAIIVVGAMVLLGRMVTVADDNKDKSFASLQVQYVGFWLNEDIAQAQMINLGNATCADDGFPITMWFERGDGSTSEYIEYYLSDMEGEDGLSILYRTREVYQGGAIVEDQSGTLLVAEYIDPDSTYAERREYSDGGEESPLFSMKSVWLNVAADVDGSRAESGYEIFPRSVVDWLPEETIDPLLLGEYRGPPCP